MTCGGDLLPTAERCPHCGHAVGGGPWKQPPGGGKSRTVAVLLAVFLSFWSFLYTYRTAKWKFWLGFGLDVGLWFLTIITGVAGALFFLVSLGVWIWSIVDRATTPLDS
jgi:hypothetical protein